MPKDLMTAQEVAEELRLDVHTIHTYVRSGRLPAAKLGKDIRIRRADLEAWFEEQMVQPKRQA